MAARGRRPRESDEIKIPQLPQANQFRAWKNTLYQAANSAAGRDDDKALLWVRKVENPQADLGMFASSGDRVSPPSTASSPLRCRRMLKENWAAA